MVAIKAEKGKVSGFSEARLEFKALISTNHILGEVPGGLGRVPEHSPRLGVCLYRLEKPLTIHVLVHDYTSLRCLSH